MGREQATRIGEEIEAELLTHEAHPAISILHKQGGAGCLRKTALWSCWRPIAAQRSFDWIGENAILTNTALYVLWNPFSCAVGGTYEVSSMTLLDQGEFLPFCHGAGSPFGPRGYATQEDVFKCCFGVDCTGLYNTLLRPFCGEFLCILPCENGSRGFHAGVTPCLKLIDPCGCCMAELVGCCLADSETYRAVLMNQVAHSQGLTLTDNQRRALAPPALAHEMAR